MSAKLIFSDDKFNESFELIKDSPKSYLNLLTKLMRFFDTEESPLTTEEIQNFLRLQTFLLQIEDYKNLKLCRNLADKLGVKIPKKCNDFKDLIILLSELSSK